MCVIMPADVNQYNIIRASEPQEISHIHELKENLFIKQQQEAQLDKKILACRDRLHKIINNQGPDSLR